MHTWSHTFHEATLCIQLSMGLCLIFPGNITTHWNSNV